MKTFSLIMTIFLTACGASPIESPVAEMTASDIIIRIPDDPWDPNRANVSGPDDRVKMGLHKQFGNGAIFEHSESIRTGGRYFTFIHNGRRYSGTHKEPNIRIHDQFQPMPGTPAEVKQAVAAYMQRLQPRPKQVDVANIRRAGFSTFDFDAKAAAPDSGFWTYFSGSYDALSRQVRLTRQPYRTF